MVAIRSLLELIGALGEYVLSLPSRFIDEPIETTIVLAFWISVLFVVARIIGMIGGLLIGLSQLQLPTGVVMSINMIHDIVEANGKTIRENNLARTHTYPIGTLVEVRFDEWLLNGASWKVHARLWIIEHRRDCDGTPLYVLSRYRDPIVLTYPELSAQCFFGFGEQGLTPVEITPEVESGEDRLKWED